MNLAQYGQLLHDLQGSEVDELFRSEYLSGGGRVTTWQTPYSSRCPGVSMVVRSQEYDEQHEGALDGDMGLFLLRLRRAVTAT